MSLPSDLYKILGLEKTATKDEIKKAYRILSLKYHPDKNQKDTTLLFQSINDSYSILYDDNKRKDYDSSFYKGHQHLFQGGGGGGGCYTSSSSNSFHKMMPHKSFQECGSSASAADALNIHQANININQAYPSTIIKELEITTEQSYNGCDVPIEIVRWVYEDNIKKEERETIYVSIQKGIDDNEVIELKQKGHVLNYQTKGDVKLFIKVKNDTIFTRNGLDLHMKHNVTLKEALCGFSFNLTFINNKIFKINSGAGNIVSPGFKQTIKNMGITRGEKTGSLVIEFNIIFPEQLSSNQIKVLEEIF